MPAPSARRLSPPPTPPWHRLLGPATRQAQLVHRGPGLSATRRVVLASCHSPAFPHPEAVTTSRLRPLASSTVRANLYGGARPGARRGYCGRRAQKRTHLSLPRAAACLPRHRKAAATFFPSWGCGGSTDLSSLTLHPHSPAAQSRGAPHPSRVGSQRADSPGPARPLAHHRAVTRPPLPFSAP